jgi:hypothetical protein
LDRDWIVVGRDSGMMPPRAGIGPAEPPESGHLGGGASSSGGVRRVRRFRVWGPTRTAAAAPLFRVPYESTVNGAPSRAQ